jgi:hypothetical protein
MSLHEKYLSQKKSLIAIYVLTITFSLTISANTQDNYLYFVFDEPAWMEAELKIL